MEVTGAEWASARGCRAGAGVTVKKKMGIIFGGEVFFP